MLSDEQLAQNLDTVLNASHTPITRARTRNTNMLTTTASSNTHTITQYGQHTPRPSPHTPTPHIIDNLYDSDDELSDPPSSEVESEAGDIHPISTPATPVITRSVSKLFQSILFLANPGICAPFRYQITSRRNVGGEAFQTNLRNRNPELPARDT
jgi:hypothetical protein